MRKNEFNDVKINNEKSSSSFSEFGQKQSHEFTSYRENKTDIKCEINEKHIDNPYIKKEDVQFQHGKNKHQSPKTITSASGVAPSGSVAASIVGASVVTVTTISVLVGINAYVRAKVEMNELFLTPDALIYDLDLSDTYDDDFIIKLENKENNYASYQELFEGNNSGEFDSLLPETAYDLSIIDETRDHYPIYHELVTTLPRGTVTYEIRFYIDDTYTTQIVVENDYLVAPNDPVKDGYIFKGWSTTVDSYTPYDFSSPVTSSFNLYANFVLDEPGIYSITWDKSFSATTGEMEYSINYRDDGSLSNFVLSLTATDDKTGAEAPQTYTYPLNIAEGTQVVTFGLREIFLKQEYEYAFSYSRGQESDIIVETGLVTFTNADVAINNFAFDDFLIDDNGFTAHYNYDASGKASNFVDKTFNIKFTISTYAAVIDVLDTQIDIEKNETSGTLISTTPLDSDDFNIVYDYAIYFSDSDASLYNGSVAPYYKQKNQIIGLSVGGFNDERFFYHANGNSPDFDIPLYIVLNDDINDFVNKSAYFVFRLEGDTNLYKSANTIALEDIKSHDYQLMRWENAMRVTSGDVIQISYAALEVDDEIIYEENYQYPLEIYETQEEDELQIYGGRIANIDSLSSTAPALDLYLLSNHNISNLMSLSVNLYYMNSYGEYSNNLLISKDVDINQLADDSNLLSIPLYYFDAEQNPYIDSWVEDIIRHDSFPLDMRVIAQFNDGVTAEYIILKNVKLTFAD